MRAFQLPFSAIVGNDQAREVLLWVLVNRKIGGVLLRGPRGTGKSTAARALSAILPQGSRVVELPLNASEDRVVGSIDIGATVASGTPKFEGGVLASAHHNVLYIDEVNLLDDHLVDSLLDVAASGVNVVEREGVSFEHPSAFVLVGSMNPEEGELRPQLLDRFGLCVEWETLKSPEQRVALIEIARDRDRAELDGRFLRGDERLRREIGDSVAMLPHVGVSGEVRAIVAAICADAGVKGHRADVVMEQAARAHAALRCVRTPGSDPSATPDDVRRVAPFVLAHRRTRTEERGAQPSTAAEARPPDAREPAKPSTVQPPGRDANEQGEGEVPPPVVSALGNESDDAQVAASNEAATPGGGGATAGAVYDGDTFAVRKIRLPRNRQLKRARGKRDRTVSENTRGRYVGSRQVDRVTDVALDATLRAAAPHQRSRRRGVNAVALEPADLRQKVRQRRAGALIVLVVDASASMDAERRMQATKGAVLSLLHDAYVRRDKVALVVFSGRAATVALQPTSSVKLAEDRLARLIVGGTTPLVHGLLTALDVIHVEKVRDPATYPLMVLISDGRGNISHGGEEPTVEAQRVAARIRAEGIRVLVIDSARDFGGAVLPRGAAGSPIQMFGHNACQDLASRAGGDYLGLYDLSQRDIVQGIEHSLRNR